MVSLAGCITALFPYVERIELGPIEIDEKTDQCKRTLTIVSLSCTLELVLYGPTPETLAFDGN
jgi:hypothetical protein